MILAPSLAGASLGVAAFIAFLSRRPLKTGFAARHSLARRDARETLGLLSSLAVTGMFETLVLGDASKLWPLAIAAPAGIAFAYFDRRGESRAGAAEIAGSAAFALLPATFATLAGGSAASAGILALFALVRSVPTVLTLRAFLRQRKGEPQSAVTPGLAAGLGFVLVSLLAATGRIAWPAAIAAALLFGRTIWLLGPWRPRWTARRAGISELFLGLAYLAFLSSASPVS